MGDTMQKLRLAAVQASPVLLDREATVDKTCALIREAGANGADVIGFPEGFIPAHPHWFNYIPATCRKSLGFSRELFKNAVVIPSPATDRLGRACKEANIVAVIGLCEKRANTTGTMWNSQLFIDAEGEIIGKHQKIMPTVGERIVHTGGHGDTLISFPMPFGNLTGLVCGENSNPLAAFTMAAMNTVVHVAAWPALFNSSVWMPDAIEVSTRCLAYQLSAFVINAVGEVTDEMIEAYAETDEDRVHFERCKNAGAASIIGPLGKIVAGPMAPGEGILYADVDLEDVLMPKLIHDFGGHYNRFDVFNLTINVDAPRPLSHVHTQPGGGWQELRGPDAGPRRIDTPAGRLTDRGDE